MRLAPIYAITDATLLPGPRLTDGVEAALRGGVRLIQYRDKSADSHQKHQNAQALMALCDAYQAQLIINDDVELAAACGAHGIHLGQEDTSVSSARSHLGADAIIGVTCHGSLELARAAIASGADYVAFGRFFQSATKPSASAASLAVLDQALVELDKPVVAIGGINLDNMAPLVERGVHCLAVCHALFGAPNIEAAAKAMLSMYMRHQANSQTSNLINAKQ